MIDEFLKDFALPKVIPALPEAPATRFPTLPQVTGGLQLEGVR